MSQVLLTTAGAIRLRHELERLTRAVRSRALAELAEARQRGNPADNGDYVNAATELAFGERRIAELEGKLAAAHRYEVVAVRYE